MYIWSVVSRRCVTCLTVGLVSMPQYLIRRKTLINIANNKDNETYSEIDLFNFAMSLLGLREVLLASYTNTRTCCYWISQSNYTLLHYNLFGELCDHCVQVRLFQHMLVSLPVCTWLDREGVDRFHRLRNSSGLCEGNYLLVILRNTSLGHERQYPLATQIPSAWIIAEVHESLKYRHHVFWNGIELRHVQTLQL